MRSVLRIVLIVPLLCLVFFAPGSQAQCPEDPIDSGICDTLYVEVWDHDNISVGQPKFVLVPMYVTHDVPDPDVDSIAGFVIPLCFTHTNPSKYCSLAYDYNYPSMPGSPPEGCWESVFRPIPDCLHPEVSNRMWDMHADGETSWDFRFIDCGDWLSYFRLAIVPTGTEDQLWWEGSRVLLATMTFHVEDTMTVCMDSCFWPPTSRLMFGRGDAQMYVPRTNLPYCFSMTYPGRGDCNADGVIDLEDVLFMLNYLFKKDSAPAFSYMGDANSDGILDLGDVVYLLGYLFRGGSPPGP